MKGAFELHAHTTCSDGVLAPAALVELAASKRLRALAVTDHDTVAGLVEAAPRGQALGVEVIPGVEITCGQGAVELHLLGYFVDPLDRALAAALLALRDDRRARAAAMLERLAALGAPIDARELGHPHAVTRGHLARLLLKGGRVASARDAFERYLGVGAPAYVPKRLIPLEEAVERIHAAGGVAVLAHPGRYSAPPDLEAAAASGIDGIEAHYPSHGEAEVDRFVRFARERGLVITGGADYHGPDGRVDLGAHPVPAGAVDDLRARASARGRSRGADPGA